MFFVDKLLEYNVWMMLQWYYLPMKMIARGDEMDQWIKTVSLNGLASNICNPKLYN